jgi:hypothetical protein
MTVFEDRAPVQITGTGQNVVAAVELKGDASATTPPSIGETSNRPYLIHDAWRRQILPFCTRTFLDRNGPTEKRQGGKTGGPRVEMQTKFCTLSGGFSKISGV